MNHQPTLWDNLQAIGEFIGGVGMAFGAIFGALRLVPMMWNRALLVTKLDSAEVAAREYRTACERLHDTVKEQRQSIILLEERNAELRKENDEAERRFTDFAFIAGSFIIALVDALKAQARQLKENGVLNIAPLPAIPEELEETVAAAQRVKIRRAQEVTQAERPFGRAPEGGATS